MKDRLVLMIHGLTGNAATWGKFPDLLNGDAEIAKHFKISKPYTFTSRFLGGAPGIDALAQELATYLELSEFSGYRKIAILAHSLGGLVAKRLVADQLLAQPARPLRIERIMTFASPMLGAGGASLIRLASGQQVRDLAIGSDFLNRLGHDWASTGADSKVMIKHVVAGDDAVVGLWSSTSGFRYRNYYTIGGVGHRSVVKPLNADATAFVLTKQFLLDVQPLVHQTLDAKHYEQPVLNCTTLPNCSAAHDNIGRFIFRARSVPFTGRKPEWDTLTEFLAGADTFRWMVISGAGGTGKSRIALELCLANRDGWYAGFLPENGRSHRDWEHWQPLAPTLFVLDYATRTPDSTHLLHVLALRTMPHAAFALTQRVRVLLLIRPADERILNEDLLSGDAAMPVQLTGARQFLRLGELADPWAIFETVFNEAKKPLPDKVATLQTYRRYDPKGRPLFAFFLADAMANNAKTKSGLHHLDTPRLMTDVIARWRNQFWKPAFAREALGTGEAEVTLLLLATMCGGVPIKKGRLPSGNVAGLLPRWDPYKHPRVFAAMTGVSVDCEVPPLEPDILGEHFVVEQWAQFNDDQRQCLLNLAWSINAPGMGAFILRVWHDLPEQQLCTPVLVSLLSKPLPSTPKTAHWRSQLGINLLALFSEGGLLAIDSLLVEMKAYCDEYDQASLRECWAKGATNMLAYLGSRDAQAALLLLDEMEVFADTYCEAPLREWWAKGAYNVLTCFLSYASDDAHKLLTRMRHFADTHREATLRACWASGTFNALTDSLTRDPRAALPLLEQLQAYADTYGEVALRASWAKGAVNVLRGLVGPNPDIAWRLLDQLKHVADAYRWDDSFTVLWAKGAYNVLSDLVVYDPATAQTLLEQMKDYAATHIDVPLREWWARAAVRVLNEMVVADPKAALLFYISIERALCETTDTAELAVLAAGLVLLLIEAHQRNEDLFKMLLALNPKSISGPRQPVGLVALLLFATTTGQLHLAQALQIQWRSVDTPVTRTALRVVEYIESDASKYQ